MPVRAVYDANILISGLIFDGRPGRCLDAVASGQVECYTCSSILGEVADKLSHKFRHSAAQLADELVWCVQHLHFVEPAGTLRGVCRDPEDDVILECAVLASAQFLVTGDAALLVLKRHEAVEIVTPASFLGRL